MDTVSSVNSAARPPRIRLAPTTPSALALFAALAWLPAAASTPIPSRSDRPPDADVVELATFFVRSTVDGVVAVQCDSPQGLDTTLEIGLDAWLSHDPSLTQDKVRDFKSRLHRNGSGLARLCADTLTSSLTSADGPLATARTTVVNLMDSMDPTDRTALLQFLTSRSGAEFARVFRALDEVAHEAWAKWLSQDGTIALEQFARTAVARLPNGGAAAVRSHGVETANAGNEASSPTPEPSSPVDVRVVPAKMLNDRQLGEACESFYPVHSRMLGEEGEVIVVLFVAADGRLTSLQIQNSSGYPALDVAAAACIGVAARFAPMQRDGQPVGSWQRLKWIWHLSSATSPVAPERPAAAVR
jgi:protein TonB